MTDRRTTSMEPIYICLYDERAFKVSAKFRLPAGYLEKEFRDKYGHLSAVWLVFWLPDYRPEGAIQELKDADPQRRQEFMRQHGGERIWLEISGAPQPAEGADSQRQYLNNRHLRITPDEHGLEHYRDQWCEPVSQLLKQGRDLRTRRCRDGYNIDYFISQSNGTDPNVSIACPRSSTDCAMASSYYGRYGELHFSRGRLERWREYDGHARAFLKKYLVEEGRKD